MKVGFSMDFKTRYELTIIMLEEFEYIWGRQKKTQQLRNTCENILLSVKLDIQEMIKLMHKPGIVNLTSVAMGKPNPSDIEMVNSVYELLDLSNNLFMNENRNNGIVYQQGALQLIDILIQRIAVQVHRK
jgi:hypothetical protein